jgi:hypothetical protein
MRSVKTTWMAGGAGLVACGVLGVLSYSMLGTPGTQVISLVGDAIFATAVLLFAIGLSPDASVVARRPLGVTAMVVVAAWPLVAFVIASLLALDEPGDGSMIYGYVALIVPAGAGLVAAVQIARADVVPSPWCWAPAWALAVQAAAWAIPNVVTVAAGPQAIQGLANILAALGMLAFLVGTLGLGILALVLAAQQRPHGVEIYRSA